MNIAPPQGFLDKVGQKLAKETEGKLQNEDEPNYITDSVDKDVTNNV